MQAAVLWRATRAYSLPASIVPVLLGTVLAARAYGEMGDGRFDAWTFALVLCGAVLAHIGANVINDYFDFVHGVDTRPEHGSGVLTSGQMTAPQALAFALILFGGAAICGLLLLRTNLAVVVTLGLIGLACAVCYSAFLKKYALGDLLIVVAFGFGLTLGAFGVQARGISAEQWLWIAFLSLPICLLVDAILHANNLRDANDDRAAGVRTIATALSPAAGQTLQHWLLFGPLVFVGIGIATGLLPLWTVATLLALPLLIRASRTGSVEATAQAHLVFGVLYTVAFLLRPAFLW
jgi:1,4-dihydroxy-2-naphthoate polyprenyltransferase